MKTWLPVFDLGKILVEAAYASPPRLPRDLSPDSVSRSGDAVLCESLVFHAFVLEMVGRAGCSARKSF